MTFTAQNYWNRRYRDGRSSGEGSEGANAMVKAQAVNDLVKTEKIESIVDWGVGDGTVLKMITPDVDYTGIDISEVAIQRLQREWSGARVARRRLVTLDQIGAIQVDLALSFDVIFHCIDDFDYEMHLRRVFASASRFVLIHSSNHDGGRTARHVRWRRFTPDVMRIAPNWVLEDAPDDPAAIGFYRYRNAFGVQ